MQYIVIENLSDVLPSMNWIFLSFFIKKKLLPKYQKNKQKHCCNLWLFVGVSANSFAWYSRVLLQATKWSFLFWYTKWLRGPFIFCVCRMLAVKFSQLNWMLSFHLFAFSFCTGIFAINRVYFYRKKRYIWAWFFLRNHKRARSVDRTFQFELWIFLFCIKSSM